MLLGKSPGAADVVNRKRLDIDLVLLSDKPLTDIEQSVIIF